MVVVAVATGSWLWLYTDRPSERRIIEYSIEEDYCRTNKMCMMHVFHFVGRISQAHVLHIAN
jgi:hypothetical protein